MSLEHHSVTSDGSLDELKAALAQVTRERDEALQRDAATARVLQIISSSPGELKPVFDAMLEDAVRICGAKFGNLWLRERDHFQLGARYGGPQAYLDFLEREQVFHPAAGGGGLSTLMDTKQLFHIADVAATPAPGNKLRQATIELAGARTLIGVPMLKDGEVVGAIGIYRQEVRPFTDKQIELVQNFAAQAVIAIENARLLNELRQRTYDLAESLAQQTATSEILEVISNSPTDSQPAFDAIVHGGLKLFPDAVVAISRPDDDQIKLAAIGGPNEVDVERLRARFPMPLSHEFITGSAILDRREIDITDARNPPKDMIAGAKNLLAGNHLAMTVMPMMRGEVAVGAINIVRHQPGPLSRRQRELLRTFAAQAVIAIENTRLFNELRERTDDLTESLEQQTATAEVLSVMSRSKFDLMPILQSVVDTAVRLCRADQATISRLDGDVYRFAAGYSLNPKYLELERAMPITLGPGTVVGRAAMNRRVAQIDDAMIDPLYEKKYDAAIAGIHSMIGVPLMRDGEPIGVIALARRRVEPFSDREVNLATTFADQAVIAIENVRLFEEVQARTEDLQESLQQQTATADVLKVISRSAFDLETVLDTLLKSAGRLCDAEMGVIVQRKGDLFYRAVSFGLRDDFAELVKNEPVEMARTSGSGRALVERKIVHIFDIEADPEYTHPGRQMGGFRTLLGVPMMRDDIPVGVLTLMRTDVQPFTEKQIKLVSTFADQAAIAMENVRLFDEIQEKSRQLEEASKHKSQFLANMSHELRTPLNAILGYTELIVDGVYGETPEKVQTALKRITANGKHLLGLINDVLDLSKIEAGQLTLSLTDYSMKDVVHSVYSAVEPLAAEKKLSFKAEIAPDLPVGHGDERRLTQVLLNLVGNAIKFTDQGEVKIEAAANDGHFSVSVVDTGPGISEDNQKKLFQEFQQADSSTTKKKGGTGLGLAISKKIVEMHGGTVRLDSKPGEGSTFSFTVPLRAEQAKKQS